MTTDLHGIDTKLIHAGEPKPRILGAVAMPVFQSATFEIDPSESNLGYHHEAKYIRLNNTPNHTVLHKKLAALENAEAALVTASGMAAISTSLLTVLSTGDRVLAQRCLYGGTHGFLTQECSALGIGVDWIDADDPGSWQHRLTSTTRAIYVEAMTNPLLEVGDLRGIVEFARAHSLVSMIDNTFASPYNFRPPEIGFDLSIHSCTKYLNGHDDIAAGAVIGRADWVQKITHRLNHFGGSLDPHAAFLLHRGVKTLGVRMRHQNESALRIARFLAEHRAVSRVNYPGLESHRQHARARDLFDGFGGTLSFDLVGGAEAADRFMAGARLAVTAPSLGGVDTLIMRPATISHAGLTSQERSSLGIGDGLVRLSVGIESTEDLLEDLDQALRIGAQTG
jgi:cystathionine beta-lyase/cystathionine gamma-synthase